MKISLRQTVFIGLMAAAVFVASAVLQFPLVTPIGQTRIHMGNVLCLLGGILLGPVGGGFAAGIGSALFDLTNPVYIPSSPFTFATKFAMAWLCGILVRREGHNKKSYWLAALAGSLLYVALYLFKTYIRDRWVLNFPAEAVWATLTQKGLISLVNGLIATVVVAPLGLSLSPLLRRFNTEKI